MSKFSSRNFRYKENRLALKSEKNHFFLAVLTKKYYFCSDFFLERNEESYSVVSCTAVCGTVGATDSDYPLASRQVAVAG